MNPLFANIFGPQGMILLLIVGILLFGRRLPEMARYLGKGLIEFKKGLRGLEDDVDTNPTAQVSYNQATEAPRPPQKVAATTPKFEDTPGTVTAPPKA